MLFESRFLRVVRLIAVILFSSNAYGQRTWTVGYGREFTEIQHAVDAASVGDIILVRSNVVPFSDVVIDKGLHLLGLGGIPLPRNVDIVGVGAGEQVVVAGFGADSFVSISGCAGSVHLVSLSTPGPVAGATYHNLRIQNCALVTVNGYSLTDVLIQHSRVLINSVLIDAWVDPPPIGRTGYPGLRCYDSDVTLIRCTVWSRPIQPLGPWPAIPAIEMVGGTLRVADCGIRVNPVTWFNPFRQVMGPAIQSDGGEVIIDPDSYLDDRQGAPTAGTSTFRNEEMAYVHGGNTVIGPEVGIDLRGGEPGATGFSLFSVLGAGLPTPFGDYWLDSAPFVIGSGTFDATGLLRRRDPIGRWIPHGLVIGLQGVVVDSSGIHLSLPGMTVRTGDY